MRRADARLLLLPPAACSAGLLAARRADAGSPPRGAAAVHPQSGLRVIPLTIDTAAASAHAFRVEVARTEPSRRTG